MRKRTLELGKVLELFALATCMFSFVIVAGCATSPEKITPSYISDSSYTYWSCEELSQEQSRLAASLSTATAEQRRCRDNDIAGVIFWASPYRVFPDVTRSQRSQD